MTRLVAPSLLLLALLLGFALHAVAYPEERVPGPDTVYHGQVDGGPPVSMPYHGPPERAFVGFSLDGPLLPGTPAPTLQAFSVALDRMLGQLISDHPDVDRFTFAPGSLREGLIEALDRRLLDPDANWDPKRGVPRHGPAGQVITAELRKALDESPVPAVFEAHGFALRLDSIARIEMKGAARRGKPILVDFIYEMNMVAERRQ